MTLYSIRDWATHYELRDTKRMNGALKWIPVSTKTDGYGFGLIRQQKDAAQLLGTWYLILGIAAKQQRADRGKLTRDGIPLTAEDMALMTGFPVTVFNRALEFFSNPKQGWIVAEPYAKNAAACGKNGNDLPKMPQLAANPQQQDTTLHDTRLEHTLGAAVAAPTGKSSGEAEKLAELRVNPAYRGIDIDRELGKCRAWCAANGKVASHKRFVNWLNRAERPMAPQVGINGPRPAIPEPDDWRNWINEHTPEAPYARGQEKEGAQWCELERAYQSYLVEQVSRSGRRGAA